MSGTSCAASLDKFFTERMPDPLKQLCIARRLPYGHRIARTREIDAEHVFDSAWPGREENYAVSERERLAQIMRDEQDCLLLPFPQFEENLVHADLGMRIKSPEG